MTVTPIPNVIYVYDRTNYVAQGRTSLPGPPAPPPPSGNPRDLLVRGTYIPGWTADTAGLLSTPLTATVNGDSNGIININGGIPSDGVIRNTLFKGKIVPGLPFKLSNCLLPNRQPEQVNDEGTGNGGCLQNFGSNPPFVQLEDCLLDPQWWFDNGLSALKGSPLQVGIHGGNAKLNRCEIRHVQDGHELVGPTLQSAHDAATYTFSNGWIHAGAYFKPWPAGVPLAPASNDTHSDAAQGNTHANVLFEYSMLGGVRDLVGYNSTPAYNSGDDFNNSAIIVAQETSSAANVAVYNWKADHCWLMGAKATVNFALKNSNTGSTWDLTFNKIARRGSTQPAGVGFYIYVANGMTCPFLAPGANTNTIWDPFTGSIDGTGVLAPIDRY